MPSISVTILTDHLKEVVAVFTKVPTVEQIKLALDPDHSGWVIGDVVLGDFNPRNNRTEVIFNTYGNKRCIGYITYMETS